MTPPLHRGLPLIPQPVALPDWGHAPDVRRQLDLSTLPFDRFKTLCPDGVPLEEFADFHQWGKPQKMPLMVSMLLVLSGVLSFGGYVWIAWLGLQTLFG